MTIKDILQGTILNYGYKTVYIGGSHDVINKQFVSKSEVDRLEMMIKEYAKQKCKEQREICSGYTDNHWDSDDIENAPEPNFD